MYLKISKIRIQINSSLNDKTGLSMLVAESASCIKSVAYSRGYLYNICIYEYTTDGRYGRGVEEAEFNGVLIKMLMK